MRKTIFTRVFSLFGLVVILQTSYAFFKNAITLTPDASIFYRSAYDLLNNLSPYSDKTLFTAYNYPPITALFFSPTLVMPYSYTQIFLVICNVVLLFVFLKLGLRILHKNISPVYFFFLFCAGLLYFPYRFTVGMGQVNMIGFALILGSFLLWSKKQIFLSSLFFAVAVCIKPIFLFLVVFFLLQKSWKWLGITLLLLVGFVGTSVLFFSKQYAIYITTIVPHLLTSAGREIYYNQGLTGFIARLTTNTVIRTYVSFLASVFLFVISISFSHKQKPIPLFAIFLTLLVLVDSLSWQHHFVFLLFPFLTLLFTIQKMQKRTRWYFLLFVSFILTGMNIKSPQVFHGFWQMLLLSHAFFGTLLLLILQLVLYKKSEEKTS